MFRRLFAGFAILSMLLCFVFCALWMQSRTSMDVVMIPTGQSSALIVTSHLGRWMEFSSVTDWPGPRWGYWSEQNYLNVGPFMIWQATAWMKFQVHYQVGRVYTPVDAAGTGVLYHRAFDRAKALGFPGPFYIKNGGWASARGWQVKLPFTYPVVATAIAPMIWIAFFVRRRSLRLRREREGLCLECGYDVRASSGKCPECGAVIGTSDK